MQSHVAQNMKLHSEYCLFVFNKIYINLSCDRKDFSETTVLRSTLTISKGPYYLCSQGPFSMCFF